MKLITSLFLTSLLYVSSAQAQNLNESLILHYPFNGNTTCSTNDDYNIINSGPSLSIDRFGNNDAAFSFNGSSGFNLSPVHLNNQSLAQTLSMWIKTSNTNKVAFGELLCGIVGDGNSRFILAMDQGKISVEYGVGTGNKYIKVQTSNTNLFNDDQWHHLVLTSEGDYITDGGKLYVDGNLELTFTPGFNNSTQNVAIRIGGYREENYYTGSIDDIRLYSRVLSENEINYLKYEYPCTSTVIKEVTSTTNLIIEMPIPLTASNKKVASINVYPNPAKEYIIIESADYNDILNYTVDLLNLNGVVLQSSKFNSQQIKFNLNSLSAGTYMLRIKSPSNTTVETRTITIQ
ncbi:putative secreted protein (Por secretion system target) [Breznakibacter xylanolyticus]|uniref:Putative secreted protein (Por secretion system target) n=1 Tax=Breznakibacter xylanolyticus TaxID=990 RepID=A0A2W7N093_9BACT|nr:LamG-like jellyroll fold domain-containing protein [Breznakibacter xylanolyticus]PZX13815.1 putative secreted protein (Por secretion system target) [Breznakibacter xylanolyticus]